MDRYVTDIKNGCYQNPVLPMDFSDPDAIRVGEDYYLISSTVLHKSAGRQIPQEGTTAGRPCGSPALWPG